MKMLKKLKNNCEVPLQARRLADVALSMLCPGLATEGSGGKEAKTHFFRL